MGWASFLEDITERYFGDRFDLRVVAGHANPGGAVQPPGNPLARMREVIGAFLAYYRAQGHPVEAARSAWETHLDAIGRLEGILSASAGIDAAGPSALGDIRRIDEQLKVFFSAADAYGPLSQRAVERVCEISDAIIKRCQSLFADLRSFKAQVAALPRDDRRRQEFEAAAAELDDVVERIAADRTFLAELERRMSAIQRLWPEFLRVHLANTIHARFRPTLKQLNRLRLEPQQEHLVSADYQGQCRVQGVSGSGKTVVLVHRALRLAVENPNSSVRVFTINRALSDLLRSTLRVLHGSDCPPNLSVHCLYDFLIACIGLFEPTTRYRLIDDKSDEKIPIAWGDFLEHAGRTREVNIFMDPEVRVLVPWLATRFGGNKAAGLTYLCEEIMFIQSAHLRSERGAYLSDQRVGRAIPLLQRQRDACLRVAVAWEEYLRVGGLCDTAGVSLHAAEYFTDAPAAGVHALRNLGSVEGPSPLARIRREFQTDHVLVDEGQDLSTLELRMINRLVADAEAKNSTYVTGDFDQKVYVRHHNARKAGMAFKHAERLAKSYRNTRQILRAAQCLPRAYPAMVDEGVDPISPEYSRYDGAKPVVIACEKRDQQIDVVFDILKLRRDGRVAVVSESDGMLKDIAARARQAKRRVYELLRNEDLDRWVREEADPFQAELVIARMEAVKGYEFDTVIAVDVCWGIVPPVTVPRQEYWRPAAVVYSAFTRARDELLITWFDKPSRFIDLMRDEVEWIAPNDRLLERLIKT